jgi:hypothetical protein
MLHFTWMIFSCLTHIQILNIIKTKLQQCINNMSKWAYKNGFKLPGTKTGTVYFYNLRGLYPSSILTTKNSNIPYIQSVKFLE